MSELDIPDLTDEQQLKFIDEAAADFVDRQTFALEADTGLHCSFEDEKNIRAGFLRRLGELAQLVELPDHVVEPDIEATVITAIGIGE